MFYRLMYPGMVTVASRRIAAWSWTRWALKPYANLGTFQYVVARMFWVSLLAIFSDFTCFLFCCAISILPCMHAHFRLAEGVSLDAANIVFDEAT
jgi:hypothetical protein